jgi:transcriptional regulator with XRE-family HTH domain
MTMHAILPVMGNKLKELRKKNGWTLKRAAEAMSVSDSMYIKLERGERRLTDFYIERAAKAFGVSQGDVLDGTEGDDSIDSGLAELFRRDPEEAERLKEDFRSALERRLN